MSDETNGTTAVDAYARMDGWQNLLTGLGTIRDKGMYSSMLDGERIADEELEALYANDDFAQRIVDALVETAMRQSFELYDSTAENAADSAEDAEALHAACDALDLENKVAEAAIWGRLYGGAAILVGALGAGLPTDPLDASRIKSLPFLTVFDRRDLTVERTYSDKLASNYGEPERFTIASTEGYASSVVVHESRLIRFPGVRTTRKRKRENKGWDDSALQRVYEVLRTANTNWQSVSHLLSDASQAVYTLKYLHQMIAGGHQVTLQQRMQAVELGRSVCRAILLGEDEKFERIATSFAGLPEMTRENWQRLSAAARMPLTVLMGMSPAGLNATGESDLELWFGEVQAYRENTLRKRLETLVRMVAASTGDADPERWCVRFPPLKQMSAKEKAELEKLTAEKDAAYITAGVLLPQEVALARYGKGEWSPETAIDAKMRDTEPKGAEPEDDEEEGDDVVEVTPTKPADAAPVEKAADTALNGAQVTSAVEIVKAVASQELPRETGVAMLAMFFNLSAEQAEKIMGPVGQGFEPKEKAAPPPFGAAPPKPDEPKPPEPPPPPPRDEKADAIDRAATAATTLVDFRRAGVIDEVNARALLDVAGVPLTKKDR